MVTPPLVAWMNPLPLELAPALSSRRRSLARRAEGRVLDLGGWGDHLGDYRLGDGVESVTMLDRPGDVRAGTGRDDPPGIVRVDSSLDDLAADGLARHDTARSDTARSDTAPFDSIVSLIRMPLVADLDAFLTAVFGLLADDGRFLFLEPVRRAGRAGRLLALSGLVGRAAGGLHLDRDIPAELRRRGMVVTDLYRFEVPTLSAPLRPFVEAVARRPATPPRSSPS